MNTTLIVLVCLGTPAVVILFLILQQLRCRSTTAVQTEVAAALRLAIADFKVAAAAATDVAAILTLLDKIREREVHPGEFAEYAHTTVCATISHRMAQLRGSMKSVGNLHDELVVQRAQGYPVERTIADCEVLLQRIEAELQRLLGLLIAYDPAAAGPR